MASEATIRSQAWQDAAHARGCCVQCNQPHKTKSQRTGQLARVCVHCQNRRIEQQRQRRRNAEAAR